MLGLLNVLNPLNSHILYVCKIKRRFILCKTLIFGSSEHAEPAELAELIQSYFTKPPKEGVQLIKGLHRCCSKSSKQISAETCNSGRRKETVTELTPFSAIRAASNPAELAVCALYVIK